MKTSNKLLLFGMAVLVFLPGVVVIRTAVFFFYQQPDYVIFSRHSETMLSRTLPPGKFRSVDLEGFWKIRIVRGGVHTVLIKATRETHERMAAEMKGDVLRVSQNYFSLGASRQAEIIITMPGLKGLRVRGGNDVHFSGFKDENIAIDLRGLADVRARDCSVERLRLSGVGAVGVDLSACSVKNAKLDMKGLGEVKLNMNGGVLEGRVSREISVEHTGNLKSKTLTTKRGSHMH